MNNNKIPFCKVCFDSGKPDTNHWVKDRSGKVCCPTLIGLKCRLCGQCGHTVKYCSKAQPTMKAQPSKPTIAAPEPTSKPEQKVRINKFDLLFNFDDFDDDEPEQEQAEQEQAEQKKSKRWIDYDSDSDDESPAKFNALPMPKFNALPIPTLKRYGHSDNPYDSLINVSI